MIKPIRTYEVDQINVWHSITKDGTQAHRSVSLGEVVPGKVNSSEADAPVPGSSLYVSVEDDDIENFTMGRKAYLVWAEEN